MSVKRKVNHPCRESTVRPGVGKNMFGPKQCPHHGKSLMLMNGAKFKGGIKEYSMGETASGLIPTLKRLRYYVQKFSQPPLFSTCPIPWCLPSTSHIHTTTATFDRRGFFQPLDGPVVVSALISSNSAAQQLIDLSFFSLPLPRF